MYCENCKKTTPEDSKFCVHCGKEVEVDNNKKEDTKIKINYQKLPKIVNDIRNHLEFIGYEIRPNQIEENGVNRFLAVHKNRSNLLISYLPGSNVLLFIANFKIPKIETEVRKRKILELANRINGTAAVISTLCIYDDFAGLSFSTWYPDYYSKKDFSNFLEIFQNEINRLCTYKDLQEFV